MPLFAKKPSAAAPPANGEPAAAAPPAPEAAGPMAAVAAAAGGAAAAAPPPTAVLRMPDGAEILLPVLTDAAGARFLDVRRLQPTTGICTFDPGFTSTAACASAITYIDGGRGVLLYRGYPIEEVAARGDFFDAAFLLLHGELPDAGEKAGFESEIRRHTLVHESLIQFYRGFRHDAHPMAIMCGVVGGLSAFYPQFSEVHSPRAQHEFCIRIIAKMPTLAAMAYRTSKGLPIVYPRNDLPFAANFLHMMFSTPCERYEVDAELAAALETIFVLHLDHEQNASTSTVRTAGSSQANPFACVASGIAALWGPAHGGANQAVLEMLEDIAALGGVAAIPAALARARDKADPFRLMGFGHRVYKTRDPRAEIMAGVAKRVLAKTGKDDPLLAVATALEAAALADDYFVSRSLYPNVDFYSGIVLRALGFPVSMFTVLFAMARTVGWVAQWREMVAEPVNRISRPRQMYTGAFPARAYPRVLDRRASGLVPRGRGGARGEGLPALGEEEAPLKRLVSSRVRGAY